MVTTGATEAIAATLLALCEPGDEVVMFEPSYDSYAACAAMAGAGVRLVRLHPPDWSFDPAELAAAIGPRTRMILLNTPHNPTGKVFGPDELALIAQLCCDHDILAVTDEVYEHLIFEGTHIPLATLPGMAERTVSISSGGKTFSFTGWKVGWVTAPAPLLAAVRAVKQFLTYTSGAPFQLAIARGLSAEPERINALGAELQAKRDLFCDGLATLGLTVLPTSGHLLRHHRHRRGRPGPERPRLLPGPARTLRRGGHPQLGVLRRPASRRSPARRMPAGPWSVGPSASGTRSCTKRCAVSNCGPLPHDLHQLGRCLHRPGLHRQPGRGVPPEHRGSGGWAAAPMSEDRMQSLAYELGISETAFVTPVGGAGGGVGGTTRDTFALRWFSPSVEIDLCGHATLASAHVLRQRGVVDGTAPVTFHTRSGPLVAAFEGDRIDLDFPTAPMTTAPLPDALVGEWDDGAVVATGTTDFFCVVVLSS